MSLLLVVLIITAVSLIFVSLVLMVIGPVMLLQPHRRTIEYYRRYRQALHPKDLGVPHEEFTLKTAEGIPLSCWFLKAAGISRGTIIYLHGVSECKIVGLPVAKLLHDHGYNVFLYDSRRHGDSGGQYCTYGFYEKHDASTIINHLEQRPDIQLGSIGLWGVSMGAAVALQVGASDPRISAIVAESGFATLRTIFDDYQKRMIKLPWHYLRNIVIKRSERIAHFKANAVSPMDAVRTIRVPLFILHGTKDNLIDAEYSKMVFRQANEPKELWLVEGARHNDMREIGGEEYDRRIIGFFEKHLDATSTMKTSS